MTKLNSVPVSLKNRPRIPTPDVTKEVIDREQRLALSASNTANIGAGVVGVIPANGHYTTDLPVVQVVLSPIQETEGTPSNAKSGAAALAQAVLSPTLTSAGLVAPVTLTPVTMSQLTQLGLVTTTSASSYRPTNIQNNNTIQATLTEVNSSEEEGSGSGSSSSRSESIMEQEERSTPLIGENTSPNISNGGSPTFDSYNDRSPILMNPEKLSYVVALPTTQESHLQTAIEPRGRRSASLPGPPVVQPREDRSMSLPHSPGLQPRETRAASISSRNDHPNLDRLAIISPNHDLRPRTNSFGHELTKNNQQRNQETSRKISSASCNNAAITTAPVVPNQTTATPSKRGEVYV